MENNDQHSLYNFSFVFHRFGNDMSKKRKMLLGQRKMFSMPDYIT